MRPNSRLSPLPPFDYDDKQDQLSDWVANTNSGIMGFIFGDVPPECLSFCMSQYERFNVPMPAILESVVVAGSCATFYYMDCVDPYVLFSGISDVDATDDWAMYAHEVMDDRGKAHEINPESLETYVFRPGQDERVFHNIMSHPGLKALPVGLGDCIADVIHGEYGSDCCYTLSMEADDALRSICTAADGRFNREMHDAYFELAAWATCAWLIGPLGRDFRYTHHDVFCTAMDHGEAILYDGTVLPPKFYRKLSRPPKSCAKCGIPAWCVELVSSGVTSRYMCESCYSEGMPPSSLSTCGSKRCLLTTCPHHPYHSLGAAGIQYARKDYGQLGASARGESALRIKGGRGG